MRKIKDSILSARASKMRREPTEPEKRLWRSLSNSQLDRFFRSDNLRGQTIPDIPGERAYTVEVNGIGELRVGEFLLPPFDVTVGTPLAPVRDVMTGYRQVLLDTLPVMEAAQAMYTRLGFKEVEPYRPNPVVGARFMRLDLD